VANQNISMHYFGAIKYTMESFKPMLRGGLMDTWEQYYTAHGAEPFLRSCQLRSHSNNNPSILLIQTLYDI
jgi:hypothetical protein